MNFNFDFSEYRYTSKRNVVFGSRGMVATGSPFAAIAGLDILKKGGNAVDAIIATAATLTVTEPTANGIGGDAFSLIWMNGKLHGMNSSGYAPKSLNYEVVKSLGHTKMPDYGVIPINVPGIPAAWAALSKKFGKLPFEELLKPAIQLAEDGYAIQPILGRGWERSYEIYSKEVATKPEIQSWLDTFTQNGCVPKTGEIVKLPYHADTLKKIAATKSEAFYRGELAEKIDKFMKEHKGYLSKEDLASFETEWVEPISTEFMGYNVHEIPPNGHGVTALMALNILKGLDLKDRDSFESTHYQIEATKLAFIDTRKYLADQRYMKVTVEELLSEEYAASRRKLITDKAIDPKPSELPRGGTVYMCSADGEGNMVSYIQSNYMGFGSGVVIPGTGISLHNRGANFNLDENSANCLMGGKKPYHTIIPGFLTKDNKAVGAFGVMGGFLQPQAHLQVLINTIVYGMNPQETLDRPRWQWTGGKTIEVEQSFDNCLAQKLERAGHNIVVKADSLIFGRGEIIWRNDNGILCGGCEPRTDAMIATW